MAEVTTGRHLARVLPRRGGEADGDAQRREAVLLPQRVDVGEHPLLERRERRRRTLRRRACRRCDDPEADRGEGKRDEAEGTTPHGWPIGAAGTSATSLERATRFR